MIDARLPPGAGPPSAPHREEPPLNPILTEFRSEVLRWNRQINLISRVDPEGTLDIMLEECLAAARVLPSALDSALGCGWPLLGTAPSPFESVTYVDIGSGAGLPGIVWHCWLMESALPGSAAASAALRTFLVEPRGKRAWFLERMARSLPLPGVQVLRKRWEKGPELAGLAVPASPGEKRLVLISLKALGMPDPDVAAGWRSASGPTPGQDDGTLVVCRFRSQAGAGEEALRDRPAPPQARPPGEMKGWVSLAPPATIDLESRRPGGASLLLSFYGSAPSRG